MRAMLWDPECAHGGIVVLVPIPFRLLSDFGTPQAVTGHLIVRSSQSHTYVTAALSSSRATLRPENHCVGFLDVGWELLEFICPANAQVKILWLSILYIWKLHYCLSLVWASKHARSTRMLRKAHCFAMTLGTCSIAGLSMFTLTTFMLNLLYPAYHLPILKKNGTATYHE